MICKWNPQKLSALRMTDILSKEKIKTLLNTSKSLHTILGGDWPPQSWKTNRYMFIFCLMALLASTSLNDLAACKIHLKRMDWQQPNPLFLTLLNAQSAVVMCEAGLCYISPDLSLDSRRDERCFFKTNVWKRVCNRNNSTELIKL